MAITIRTRRAHACFTPSPGFIKLKVFKHIFHLSSLPLSLICYYVIMLVFSFPLCLLSTPFAHLLHLFPGSMSVMKCALPALLSPHRSSLTAFPLQLSISSSTYSSKLVLCHFFHVLLFYLNIACLFLYFTNELDRGLVIPCYSKVIILILCFRETVAMNLVVVFGVCSWWCWWTELDYSQMYFCYLI